MRVIAAAETDAGICKPINQDGYCIKIAQTPAGQVALAAVCDGMGGLEKGELASATAVRAFSAWFDQTLPGLLPELDWMRVSEMWRAMIHDVDVRLHEYGAAHGLELGTTVTAILIYGGKYLIAHVGDTRVYEVGGVLRQLTEDHTVVEREVQAGLLTPEAAESARAAPPAKAAEARCAESGAESGGAHGGCPAAGSGDHAGGAHVYAHLNGVF